MGQVKSLKDKLRGAAVLKMSFRLRDTENSPQFRAIYPGVIESLGLTDAEVEAYIEENRDGVVRLAQSGADDDE